MIAFVHHLRRVVPVACLFAAVSMSAQTAPTQEQNITQGVFGHLLGEWDISGSTLGKPTRTGAQVQPNCGGTFFELHIKDPARRDQYQARVFLGQKQDGRLVIHWLDRTGADTSQSLGTGKVSGDVVTMTFPYPEREFRDIFTYEPASDHWRLLIQTGPVDHPKVFSDWYFVRSKH